MKTICLDLDGTLTDPRIGITRSIRYAMEKLGRPVPDGDDLTWCIGPPLLESFEQLLGDAGDARTALAAYRERFSDVGIFENAGYGGVREALEALEAAGTRLFVATSKPTVYAKRIIEYFDLAPYFDTVCGSELDGTRSDKTDLLSWLLREKQLDASSTIMVGDRRHDIIGARNNGIAAVGVLYGFGTKAELIEAGARRLLESPGDMAGMLT